MFFITSLKFQGIRSFPEGELLGNGNGSQGHQDIRHRITFDRNKITLIQGSNGAGKTTTMEALKFGLTGNPPSSPDMIASFLRDPVTSDNYEAQMGKIEIVLLEEDELANQSTEWRIRWNIQRDRNICRKPTYRIWRNGEDYSSGKQKGFSTEISGIFKIQPAVWENIIMVPQEDAIWPFIEPGKVKQKFDAFFNMEQQNKDLEDVTKRLAEAQKEMEAGEPALQVVENRYQEYNKRENALTDLNTELLELTQNRQPLIREKVALGKRDLDTVQKAHGLLNQIKIQSDALGSNYNLQEIQNLDSSKLESDKTVCEGKLAHIQANIKKAENDKRNYNSSNQKKQYELNNLNQELGKMKEQHNVSEEAKKKIISILKPFGFQNESDDNARVDAKFNLEIKKINAKWKEHEVKSQCAKDLVREMEMEEKNKENLSTELSNATSNISEDNNISIPKAKWNRILELIESATECTSDLEEELSGEENVCANIDEVHHKMSRRVELETMIKMCGDFKEKSHAPGSKCPLCSTPFGVGKQCSTAAELELKICAWTRELDGIPSTADLHAQYKVLIKREVYHQISPVVNALQESAQGTHSMQLSDTLNTNTFKVEPELGPMDTDSPNDQPSMQNNRARTLESFVADSQAKINSLRKDLSEMTHVNPTSQIFDIVSVLNHEDKCQMELKLTSLARCNKSWSQIMNLRYQVKPSRVDEYKAELAKCEKEIEEWHGLFNVKSQEIEDFKTSASSETDKLREINKKQSVILTLEKMEEANHELVSLRNGDPSKFQDLAQVVKDLGLRQRKLEKLTNELKSVEKDVNTKKGQIRTFQEMQTREAYVPANYRELTDLHNIRMEELRKHKEKVEQLRHTIINTHKARKEEINDALSRACQELCPPNNNFRIKLFGDIKKEGDKRVDYDYHFEMVLPSERIQKIRGHSSLGEKYLASIIIRYALAEVFAPNFPIFGFDAPEGNMDAEVIENLMSLFKRWSETPGKIKQLIITTPSEQFAQDMRARFPNMKTYVVQKVNMMSSVTEVGN